MLDSGVVVINRMFIFYSSLTNRRSRRRRHRLLRGLVGLVHIFIYFFAPSKYSTRAADDTTAAARVHYYDTSV